MTEVTEPRSCCRQSADPVRYTHDGLTYSMSISQLVIETGGFSTCGVVADLQLPALDTASGSGKAYCHAWQLFQQ